MFVIGTSGHVDHGKTLLIEALTGVNTDRLPEERERGMTIDLGFAHFRAPSGEPIGVIDVPGHERFIRNMVAGAWGIDCALLVVAADDGWMEQTEDHAAVLRSMAVPSIVAVLSKIDIADPESRAMTAADILKRCERIFGYQPRLCQVSAKTGDGIEELKSAVIEELKALPKPEAQSPWLYVDRVFTVKGSGTVVTGTLRGGALFRDQSLLLLPAETGVKIRGLQTYYSAVSEVQPVSRVALNLQGVKREGISRGDLLTAPDSRFKKTSEFIALLSPSIAAEHPASEAETTGNTEEGNAGNAPEQQNASEPGRRIRNHGEVEIALGTAHTVAAVHFMGSRRIARFVLSEPVAACVNQPIVLIQHGGSGILGGGRIHWLGQTTREQRKKLETLLPGLPENPKQSDLSMLALSLHGYLSLSPQVRLPKSAKETTSVVGAWVCDNAWLAGIEREILSLASAPGGTGVSELSGKLTLEQDLVRGISGLMVSRGRLTDRSTRFFPADSDPEQSVSPAARELLETMRKNGIAGLELSKDMKPGAAKELRNLCRLGFAVSLEGEIYYAAEIYQALVKLVLSDLAPGRTFSIPEAKERAGITRKYMIPLLLKMENEGYVKRDGDVRVVVRNPFSSAR
jgi:selenocysteine-specific elongation factor